MSIQHWKFCAREAANDSDGPALMLLNGKGNTAPAALLLGGGTNADPVPLGSTASKNGFDFRLSSAAASGTTRGFYIRLDSTVAGAEVCALRPVTYVEAANTQAYGIEAGVEFKITTGRVTGLAAGARIGLILPGAALPAGGGTYYGAQAFINAPASCTMGGSTAHAVLDITAEGAAKAVVLNALSINGGADSGGGQMISPGTSMGTVTGTIRVLINGAAAFIPYYSHEGHA